MIHTYTFAQITNYRTGGSLGCAPGWDAGDSDRTNTQGLKITEEKSAAFVISSTNDFLVFSDKDDKPEGPSHNSLNVDNSVGR